MAELHMDNGMDWKRQIRGLQHIGLPVRNLEDSLGFWNTLGFETMMRRDIPNDGGVRVAMVSLGGLTIELYEHCGAILESMCARPDGHWDHVALDVADIDAVFAAVKKAGWTVLEGEPQFLPFWENGVRYLTVRGPNGEKVEFNQRL